MRGVELSDLVEALKEELGDAAETNTAQDTRYKRLLAHKQSDLAKQYDWPWLHREWDLSIDSGDRYKDIPLVDTRAVAATINFEKQVKVYTFYNNDWLRVDYGIGPNEYNLFDSDANEGIDPITRWQVATNLGEATNDDQIEVWPIPVSGQVLRFVGQREINSLEDDTDKCDLDDQLIVLGVAAEQLALRGQANAPLVLRRFNERLWGLRGGQPGREVTVNFSKRSCECEQRPRTLVIAGGRPVSSYSGSVDLEIDLDTGVVTFTSALNYTPTVCNLTVTKPAGGDNIFVTLITGTLTSTGFAFNLSASPATAGYKLHFIVTP